MLPVVFCFVDSLFLTYIAVFFCDLMVFCSFMSILQHSHSLAGLSAWVPLQAGLNGGPYSLRDAPVNPSGQVGLWAILMGIYNEPASLSGWGWQNSFQGWHSLLARDLNQAELSTEFSDQRRPLTWFCMWAELLTCSSARVTL